MPSCRRSSRPTWVQLHLLRHQGRKASNRPHRSLSRTEGLQEGRQGRPLFFLHHLCWAECC